VTIKPNEPEPKKPYAAPRMIAYGSVSLLTKSFRGSGSDGGTVGSRIGEKVMQ